MLPQSLIFFVGGKFYGIDCRSSIWGCRLSLWINEVHLPSKSWKMTFRIFFHSWITLSDLNFHGSIISQRGIIITLITSLLDESVCFSVKISILYMTITSKVNGAEIRKISQQIIFFTLGFLCGHWGFTGKQGRGVDNVFSFPLFLPTRKHSKTFNYSFVFDMSNFYY